MSKAAAALQSHTYIHSHIQTEKLFAKSELRFKKKNIIFYVPFIFTQGAIVHGMEQGMCHLKGDLLGIQIIL